MQRGRKSAASLATPNVTGERPRLTAPASLSTDERSLFTELVNACDASHFRSSDVPLLTSFVQATLAALDAAGDPDKIAVWERAVKVQAMLATRLRLTPQSRIDPKTLGRQQHFPGAFEAPWHRRRNDDELDIDD